MLDTCQKEINYHWFSCDSSRPKGARHVWGHSVHVRYVIYVDNIIRDVQNSSSSSYRKTNSIIALLLFQNISPFLKGVSPFRSLFFRSPKKTQPRPQFFSIINNLNNLNNLQLAAFLTSFWRHRFHNLQRAALLTSLVLYLVNTCGFNQSETGNILDE